MRRSSRAGSRPTRLELAPAAVADLKDLGAFLEQAAGRAVARRHARQLLDASRRLVEHPDLGAAVLVQGIAVRRLVCGHHIVYYRLANADSGGVVSVLRFWDARRDPSTLTPAP